MPRRSFWILLAFLALGLAACQPAAADASPGPGAVLWSDDFTGTASGWTVAAGPAGELNYYQGTFRIIVNAPAYDLWSLTDHIFRDVHVEADAGRLGGPEENRFGLVCRFRDPGNFYFFVVSSDGYYAIGKVSGGTRSLLGQEMMAYSPAIVTGILPNHLRFDCVGDTLTAYANSRQVAQARDGDHLAGDVGLLAGTFGQPGVEIIFDNFIVTNP
jgi:hypothetical protein